MVLLLMMVLIIEFMLLERKLLAPLETQQEHLQCLLVHTIWVMVVIITIITKNGLMGFCVKFV